MTEEKIKLKKGEIVPMKFDGMFTEIFNNQKNICILEEFIADYFGYELEEVRGNLEINSRKLKRREYKDNKREVDLLLTYKNKKINIEISTGWNQGTRDRNVVFLADIHSNQKYEDYKAIEETVQINLLGFNYRDKFKSTLYLADPEDGYIVSKKMRMDIINMAKGKEMCYTGNVKIDRLIKWSRAFLSDSQEELEKIAQEILTSKSKKILLSDVLRLSGDESMIKNYKEKTKHELEYESMMDEAREFIKEAKEFKKEAEEEKQELENLKQKLEESKQELEESKQEFEKQKNELIKDNINKKSFEIAKNMLKETNDLEFISRITNLSIKELESLE